MNRISQKITPVEIAILLFCLWQSQTLFQSWWREPFEHHTWIVFSLWIFPIILFYLLPTHFYPKQNRSLLTLGSALLFSILGSLSVLNTLYYYSLAIALAALLPATWHKVGWIVLAISWMPAFGWFGSYYLNDYTLVIRIAVSTCAAAWMIGSLINYSSQKLQDN